MAQISVDLPEYVGILLFPGFSMLSFCGLIEPLRLANQLLGRRHYSWRIYASDAATVQASCGLRIPVDAKPDAFVVPSCLFVVACFNPWPQDDPHLKSWLRALDRHGSILGAVDTGSFFLASAGLIKISKYRFIGRVPRLFESSSRTFSSQSVRLQSKAVAFFVRAGQLCSK
jgi:transcriptional regulator GlxA family with amidase domain